MQQTIVRKRNASSEWAITAEDAERRLARAIRICVGNELRKMYGDLLNKPVPPKIADLLRRLESLNTTAAKFGSLGNKSNESRIRATLSHAGAEK